MHPTFFLLHMKIYVVVTKLEGWCYLTKRVYPDFNFDTDPGPRLLTCRPALVSPDQGALDVDMVSDPNRRFTGSDLDPVLWIQILLVNS